MGISVTRSGKLSHRGLKTLEDALDIRRRLLLAFEKPRRKAIRLSVSG